jgi:FlaG/FlaF family flagellin (archaellin)
MKRTITALCVAAAASWVMTAGAQTYGSSEKAQKSSTKSAKSITVTGCVQEGTMPETYTLTNVTGTSGSWGGSGSSSGTSGTSGSGMSGETGTTGENIELVASSGVDLKAHVGHKVQVTGTPMGMDHSKNSKKGSSGTSGSGASGSGSMSGTMAGESGSQGMSGMMEHKLTVKSVKMLSDTCSGH